MQIWADVVHFITLLTCVIHLQTVKQIFVLHNNENVLAKTYNSQLSPQIHANVV